MCTCVTVYVCVCANVCAHDLHTQTPGKKEAGTESAVVVAPIQAGVKDVSTSGDAKAPEVHACDFVGVRVRDCVHVCVYLNVWLLPRRWPAPRAPCWRSCLWRRRA